MAERDLGADGVVSADDAPETIIAEGRASGGTVISGGAIPAPVLGRRVNVEVVRGRVRVRRKGAPALVALRDPSQIAVGSLIDTRRGTVRLTTATNTSGDTQSGEFSGGIFQILQSRRASAGGSPSCR